MSVHAQATQNVASFVDSFVGKSPIEQRNLLLELWPYLTAEEKKLVQGIIEDLDVWYPLPGPQSLALKMLAVCDVVGFGGSAGGGKSDLGIGVALTRHKRSAIFRRESKELTAIEDRVEELLGSKKGYNGQKQIWRFTQGKQIEFGSCKDVGDEQKYQGRPKDFLMLDEATNFMESQARFLMGWVRTTDPDQHCATLMTFNPPQDSDGEWVISYFAPWLDPEHLVPADPGEIRYFVMLAGKEIEWPDDEPFVFEGEEIKPQSRTFIPSRIADNPYLLNTGYMTQLQAMPEPLRSQMLYGDFQAGRGEDPFRVCPTKWVDAAMARWTKRDAEPKGEMSSLGVDVARGGKDDTVIFKRHGTWFDRPVVHAGKETPTGSVTASLVFAEIRDHAPVHIEIDGIGSSPYDFLVEMSIQAEPIVSGQPRPDGTDKSGRLGFLTMRSKFWWMMREALDPDNPNPIALPPDPRLKKELCAPRWKMKGLNIYVESRDDIIKRIDYSPDMATACCLALIESPKLHQFTHRAYGEARNDYNPFASMVRKR